MKRKKSKPANENQIAFNFDEHTPVEGLVYTGRHTRDGKRVFFPVVDIIAALTGSKDPTQYWSIMQRREKTQLSTLCRQLKIKASNGKSYLMDCVDIEGALRLVQSIPSKNAEPIKLRLAKIAYERIEENADPELGITRSRTRAVESWRRKGLTDQWIHDRMAGIDVRNSLTSLWASAGVTEPKEFAKRTAVSHNATFGVTPAAHKELKSLPKKARLREHMIRSELTLTSYAETLLEEMIAKSTGSGGTLDEAQRKHAELMRELRSATEATLGRRVAVADTPLKQKRL